MIRPLKVAAVALAATALLTGAAVAATRSIPALQPAAIQNPSNLTLPGDTKALDQALAATGPVKYKLLVIDSTDGEDKTTYLDRVAEQWGTPANDTLLLILYTADNYDLRFYMGANFRTNGVSVDEMLSMVRGKYFAGVHRGDVAGGLVDLITAVNQRMGVGAPMISKEPVQKGLSVADPFGGPRQSAVGQLEIAKVLLTAYFSQYKDASIAEASRLKEFRWDDNQIHVMKATDTSIEFMIKYDLLPVSANSAWMAGNGEAGKDGWIVNKTQFMSVQKDGDAWVLQGLSTSPSNP